MQCPSCGNEIKAGDSYCRQCGARLIEEPQVVTETSSPSPPVPFPPTAAVATVPAPQMREFSGWSIASLVFGILSWLLLPFIAAIVAIIFAVMAKGRIKRSGGKLRGSGLSTAGLVLGIVNLSILLLFAAVYIPLALVNMGELRTETRVIEPLGATDASVDLDIRQGNLEVRGGAQALLEAEFTYNVDRWKPAIDYSLSNGSGRLTIEQGGGWWLPTLWSARNEWDINLSDAVPIGLHADIGSGNGVFYLSSLSLLSCELASSSGDLTADISGNKPHLSGISIDQSSGNVALDLKGTYTSAMILRVKNSSGNVDIDLRGKWLNDLEAELNSSSGNISLWLPTDVGVYVTVDVSSGRVNAGDLRQMDKAYVNDLYGESEVTLRLDLELSSGNINLQSGD